jgi:hypothetical protein
MFTIIGLVVEKMGKTTTIKNQNARILNYCPRISSRNLRSHTAKHFLGMRIIILCIGIILSSSMISIKATSIQTINNMNDSGRNLFAQKFFFIGSVHNLEKNGREPTFFALFILFSHSLFVSPINFTVFYNNEHISLDNAFFYSKDMIYNRTFIIGFCEDYDGIAF